MKKLWEIGEELEQLAMALAEAGGELTKPMEDLLDKLELEFDEKAEKVALAIRTMEAQAEAAALEEKRLKKIRTGYEKGAKRLRSYLYHQLVAQKRGKLETPRVRLRIQRSSQPVVEFVGTEKIVDIPEEFTRTKVELDKARVLKVWTGSAADIHQRTAPDGFTVEWRRHLVIS